MFGLGKPRSKLGKYLDRRGIKQEWLVSKSKVGRTTISNACGNSDYMPGAKSMQKIIKALREVDPSARADQFWDL
ncbi:XRE family transcriptional regulator [Chengkuizengella marina]|uniref:XRE family transcriptional regulator n=1 Tax=Chengkuizengella marina TaxID=2507566 RepID=A0A6N9PX41_9BACL|nr:XRE family transcriptional regulator [Chengkuizengella marina]NBI28079.1 XRE family transcriptional regulator [Chengkuizengella marina]